MPERPTAAATSFTFYLLLIFMAKGNMFQGMARGKVGDVVFSRLNGQQVSRVRNRNPKNPRTNAQLYQRAIMASVMALYSAGKEIFDHSFEGYAKGADNQRRFQSENAKLLRSEIANAIEAEYEDVNVPNVTAPGIQVPVFNDWKISEGTYPMVAFEEESSADAIGWKLPAVNTDETPAAYAARVGLLADDLFTFLVFKPNTAQTLYRARTITYGPEYLYQVAFGFVRLRVKSNLATTGTVTSYADLFIEERSANVQSSLLEELPANNIERANFTVGGVDTEVGMIGLIRSREDQDLRSTSFMRYDYPTSPRNHGLCAQLLLWVWQMGTQKLGNSELILEGADF